MDLTRLVHDKVRTAAEPLKASISNINGGRVLAGEAGSWTIYRMPVDATLQKIVDLADEHDDPKMLQDLLASWTFPERYVFVWYTVSADGRNRLAAAQLYKAIQGEGTYDAIKRNIRGLEKDETNLRKMARDPNIFHPLDDPKRYLGHHKFVETTDGTTGEISPQHEQWYLNQAVLMTSLNNTRHPETKSRLAIVMLQSFNKAAKVNEGETLGYVTSPFSDPRSGRAHGDAPLYHRSTSNLLLTKCGDAITAKLGVKDHSFLRPVHDLTFSEVIKRAFSFKDAPTTIASESEFTTAIDKLFELMRGGSIPGHPVALNVTGLFDSRGGIDQIATLGGRLEELFIERKTHYLEQAEAARPTAPVDAPVPPKDVLVNDIAKVRAKVFAVVLTRYTPPAPTPPPSPVATAIANSDDAPPVPPRVLACGLVVLEPKRVKPRFLSKTILDTTIDTFSRPVIDVLLVPKAFAGSGEGTGQILQGIDSALVHTGYRLDPLQTKKIWAVMKTYKEILHDSGILLTKLSTTGTTTPTIYTGFKEFLEAQVVTKFGELAGEEEPYLKILAKATVDLLKGLADYEYTQTIKFKVALTESRREPAYTGNGTLTVEGAGAGIFEDVDCTRQAGQLTADQLRNSVDVYFRGGSAALPKVKLTLANQVAEDLEVDTVAVEHSPFDAPGDKETGIDRDFRSKGLTDLWQTSCYRMHIAMNDAILLKKDLVKFLNQIEIIHQEIATCLTLIEPHPADAFQTALCKVLTDATIVPGSLGAPRIHLKPSAMHCLASIAAGVEAVTTNNKLKVAFLTDSYYEGGFAVDEWRTYTRYDLSGDELTLSNGVEKLSLDTLAKTDDKWNAVKPLNLLICDFHHNISLTRNHYKVENIKGYVQKLIDLELVATPFTVAIDCTIDLLKSTDVKDFLEEFVDEITAGSLNVVAFRSAQKFDMLGMDNFYGGYTVTVNNNSGALQRFNTRMDKAEDQLGGANRQGLAHLMKYASQSLEDYRLAAMSNTKALYDGLPADCKHDCSSTPGHMIVSKIEDPRSVFLDIKFPKAEEKGEDALKTLAPAFPGALSRFAAAAKLPLTTRASFGFPTTNLTTIAGSKVRLNPGLETAAVMGRYAAFFKKVHENLEALGLDPTSTDYAKDLGDALKKMNITE